MLQLRLGYPAVPLRAAVMSSRNEEVRWSEAASGEERQEMDDTVISPEKTEEAKLKLKYPKLGQKPSGSEFLRKRLQKNPKYFDSGDYSMGKAKIKSKQLPNSGANKNE
eukprot:g18194.t1